MAVSLGAVDYASTTAPMAYRCAKCDTHGCKMWRGAQGSPHGLWCCDCAAESQGEDVTDIDADGTHADADVGMRVSSIGWRVPTEDGYAFWGYTSAPAKSVAWWKRLPTRI